MNSLNNKKLLLKLLIISAVSLFFYSCGSSEDDTYVTTELNGLYGYKSLYATVDCKTEDYTEDISDELVQPYFMLTGEKSFDGEIDNVMLSYCEDRRFDTCDTEHSYLFAKGTDENWVFEDKIRVKYDFGQKTCVFTKDYFKEYSFRDDILEVIMEVHSYDDESLSREDCNIKNINYSELSCSKKKKYSMRRHLISERDREYFDEQAKKEENQN